jgi:ATP-binding cassette subfamily B protein
MSKNTSERSSRPSFGPGRHGQQRIEKAKDVRSTLSRLMKYFGKYKWPLLAVALLVVLTTAFSLVGPLLMGIAIDDYLSVKDAAGLARIALAMLATYVGSWGAQAASNYIMAKISQKAMREIRQDLFDHLQTLSLKFFDQHTHGELISRLTNDVDAINRAISQNVTQLISSFLSLIGIVVMMLALNFWLALVAFIVVPLMSFVTMLIAKNTRKGFRDLQTNLGSMNGVMEEAISGQRVVLAFRRSDSVKENFAENNNAVYESSIFAQTYAQLLMPLTNVLSRLNIAIMAGVGGVLAVNGLVTVGRVATFITYTQQFTQPLRTLAQMYNTIQSALAGAERVFEIIDMQPELTDMPNAQPLENIKGEVVFDKVNFAYEPDVPVLKNVSLKAMPGETIALVGPTGAGKTTIINLLTRFYDIESGSIEIDGQSISDVEIASLRHQLGIVLQDTFLFSGTVMENIRYGRLDASDEACIEAAKLADAHHFISHLPEGYQTELSERGSNLSQGQRQLIAIARAILADPAILVLDEATSSVDTRTEVRIQRGLFKLMEGRTSFVIAHRLSTIRDADQVLVINDGEIIERGNHQSLIAQKGFYHNLYMSQFRGQVLPAD